ncbi:MAG: TolC family protein [Planctomycetes bacterium]|nr:TolC family protein [Planctomycetota bacterium]
MSRFQEAGGASDSVRRYKERARRRRRDLHHSSLLALFLAAGCAAPAVPTWNDMDARDQAFQGPTPREQAGEILRREQLELQDVLRLADLLNPRLESIRKDIDLAPLDAWNDALFPNPALRIEVEEFPLERKRDLGRSERGLGLSQSFPVGGRLGAASSVAEKEREVAALRYLWERRRILTEVRQSFQDVLAARRNLELARQTADLAKQFHDLTEERYNAQAVPEMELLKAAVNLAKAQADVRSMEAAAAVAVKRLHALIGDVDFPSDRFTGELAVQFEAPRLEALRGQVLLTHPLIELARREKELAERRLELARAKRLADVDVEALYKWDESDDRILEAGLSVPLPLFNRNQAEIAAAEVRLRQAELGMQEARNSAVLALEETYRRFEASQSRVTTYRETILPKAEQALGQTDEGYRAGKFSYLDVLDAQQTLAEARIAYVSALQDLHTLAAELEKITGSELRSVR